MTNEVKLFNNEMFGEVRVVMKEDTAWFCGKDVAVILGYKNPMEAVRTHCKGVSEILTPSAGGIQTVKYIKESDVYRLVMRSKLPEAERFENWVMEEILPALRKTGAYIVGEENMTEDQMIFAGYTALMRKCTGLEAQVNALQFTTSSLEQKVTSLEPKGDFYDAVNHAVNAIDFKTFAGMLISKATNKPYGRNTLLKDLRNHGILNVKNQPYQQYAHYFDIITATKNNQLVSTTYIKPNGVTWLTNKFKSLNLVA